MATTPAIATGMTIATAGSGGALAGDMTGLGGLFAVLMGGTAPVAGSEGAAGVPAGEGVVSMLLGGTAVPQGDVVVDGKGIPVDSLVRILPEGLPVTQDVQLGDGPVISVSGEAETLSAFVARLKDIYQKVVVEGGLTIGQLSDSAELAGALEKLGMSKEEALGVAERIQTMLDILEQQQDIDEETAGSLVAMMLAVMGQQGAVQGPVAGEEAQAFGVQFTSVVEVAVPKNAAPQGRPAGWHAHVSGDITRDLLGLGEPKQKEVKAEDAAPAEPVKKVEVNVTTDGEASVGVALPEVKAQAIPVKEVAIDGKPSAAAQAAAAVTNPATAVKVAANEVIEAPKGETYYKLQADKNGVETLDAVKPTGEARDSGMTFTQTTAQPAHVAAATQAAVASEAAAFAERVAQINEMMDKAQVGKQVAVQMIPLLEQGGGTIRMNLHPHQLGQVTVELQVVDGKVHGSIAASEPAVVEQLARELHTLRHGLADAGLKLGEQGINLMLSNSGHQDQGQGHPQGNSQAQNGSSGRGEAGDDAGLTANLAGWVAPDRVLDVNV